MDAPVDQASNADTIQMGQASTAAITTDAAVSGGAGDAMLTQPNQETPADTNIEVSTTTPQVSSQVEAEANRSSQQTKPEKGEPLTITVKDQNGTALQFKVRKNTKFEKV